MVRRAAIVASMLLVPAVVMAFIPTIAAGQREAGTSSRISGVRQSGEPDGILWPDINFALPPALTTSQLIELVGTANAALTAIQGPWNVSASQMAAAGGRIRLGFGGPMFVSTFGAILPGRPSVAFGSTPGVLLWMRALAAGERYLVDCKAAPSAASYRLIAPGRSETFTGTGHVVTTYTAPDTNPVTMKIERMDSADQWIFFGCTVSRIQ